MIYHDFARMDTNADGLVELSELSSWISIKTKEHLALALKENFFVFSAIDLNPRNGKMLSNCDAVFFFGIIL